MNTKICLILKLGIAGFQHFIITSLQRVSFKRAINFVFCNLFFCKNMFLKFLIRQTEQIYKKCKIKILNLPFLCIILYSIVR